MRIGRETDGNCYLWGDPFFLLQREEKFCFYKDQEQDTETWLPRPREWGCLFDVRSELFFALSSRSFAHSVHYALLVLIPFVISIPLGFFSLVFLPSLLTLVVCMYIVIAIAHTFPLLHQFLLLLLVPLIELALLSIPSFLSCRIH